MSYNKCHSDIQYQNSPSVATPLNDTNLNYTDHCVDILDDRIVALDQNKLGGNEANSLISNVTMDSSTGIFTFTKRDGSTFTIDTNLEKIAVNFRYDTQTEKLYITLQDGTIQEVDLSALINEFEFEDSSTIVFSVVNHKVSASIKGHSITGDHLETDYLTNCTTAKNHAETAAASSRVSELKSEGYALGKQDGVDVPESSPYYHNNAKYWCSKAEEIVGGNFVAYDTQTPSQNERVQARANIGFRITDGALEYYDGTEWKKAKGGSTVLLDAPTNLSAVAGNASVSLTWNDPSDVIIDGHTIATWGGTKVVRKVNSAPANETDGTLITTESTRNQYSSTALVDDDVEVGTTYYYGVFPYTTDGAYTYGTSTSVITGQVTITLTVEGAKEDTITITDSEGATVNVVVFGSGATSAETTLTIDEGTEYTFTSSIAKDTANEANDYSKTVVLTSESTEVKVHPDDFIYWYGLLDSNYESVTYTSIATYGVSWKSSLAGLIQKTARTLTGSMVKRRTTPYSTASGWYSVFSFNSIDKSVPMASMESGDYPLFMGSWIGGGGTPTITFETNRFLSKVTLNASSNTALYCSAIWIEE